MERTTGGVLSMSMGSLMRSEDSAMLAGLSGASEATTRKTYRPSARLAPSTVKNVSRI